VETGLDRATVRKYRSLSEKGFHDWISRPRNLPKKLSVYYNYVKESLELQPYLSSSQIEDRLMERYPDLPAVHSKTIYNFVKNIRLEHGLVKYKDKDARDYEKLPETPYGQQAQVDFGQALMQTDTSYQMKVYFFAMVLSRSRQKFIYFQSHAFTTATAIYAHELAFEFFRGIPGEIIYDQDRVFIQEENLGDILLTDGFRSFCDSNPFKPVFCRKADPESKGKIENVIKYVKHNFLRGRLYKSVGILQKEALEWLKRRGNGKVHGSTGKIPQKEWLIEQRHLQQNTTAPVLPKTMLPEYFVRKDNCITYRGNYYSLPSGTYSGPGAKVLLEIKGSSMCIYSVTRQVLAQHVISQQKGCLVRLETHRRPSGIKVEQTHAEVTALLNHNNAALYLSLLKEDRPRYFHDSLKVILKGLKGASQQAMAITLDICLENKIYNAYEFGQVLSLQKRMYNPESGYLKMAIRMHPDHFQQGMDPETSNINYYESILK
jgi:transposase